MRIDKMYEDFQKYMDQHPCSGIDITRRKFFGPKALKHHWETWQAARESLVVTPPPECFYEKADVQDFIEHMERLGLSVVLPSK